MTHLTVRSVPANRSLRSVRARSATSRTRVVAEPAATLSNKSRRKLIQLDLCASACTMHFCCHSLRTGLDTGKCGALALFARFRRGILTLCTAFRCKALFTSHAPNSFEAASTRMILFLQFTQTACYQAVLQQLRKGEGTCVFVIFDVSDF